MTARLSWTGTFRGQIGRILVPASKSHPFPTDLASVPRSLTWLVPRYGAYTKAAVLHDYLCQNIGTDTVEVFPTRSATERGAPESESREIRIEDRSDADEVFRLTMTELGVPRARRWLMWSAVSWATLATALWPGRCSKRVLRWMGRAMLLLAAIAAGVLVWAGATGFFVGGSDWKWFRITVLVIAAAVAIAGVLLAAGYVAQGRWDRWLVYIVALAMTIASLPLLALAAVIAAFLSLYLIFEDAFSESRTTRERVSRLVTPPPGDGACGAERSRSRKLMTRLGQPAI
jgi:hypothetical protein